jgi:hypothetical protein
MGNYLKVCLLLGLLLSLVMATNCQESESIDFLIFRNGSTVSGHVTRENDWYALRNDSGQGESRYPVSTVLEVCKGARETYLFLKERIPSDDPAGHCLVARFCVTNGLDKEARDEIQTALKLDRRCTDARSLLAQLENKGKKPDTPVPDLPAPTVSSLPAARLEEWPQAMQGGFTEYTKHIQPILLNGCGTTACHGTAEGRRAFTLTRGLYGAAPSPLTSRTNLERVLGLVNKEHPDESELLKRGLQIHGGAKNAPLLGADQAAYQQLQAWVATVCGIKPEAIVKSNQSSGITNPTGFASGEVEQTAGNRPKSEESRFGDPVALPAVVPSQPPKTTEPQDSNATRPVTAALPVIPGLSGKAASQLGQAPPSQSPVKNLTPSAQPDTKKQPPKNLKDDPEVLNYTRQLGVHPTIPGPDREPPRQIRVQNAGSFAIRTPAPPDIPEEYKRPAPAKEPGNNDEKSKEMRSLPNGTIVNPPKQ